MDTEYKEYKAYEDFFFTFCIAFDFLQNYDQIGTPIFIISLGPCTILC